MLPQRVLEGIVGLFLIAAILSLVLLAFKISGLTSFFKPEGYKIVAAFDDIGQLKVRSTVKMSGVTIGEVTDIRLDPTTYKAMITMQIHKSFNDIPSDSSASILTAGLLGDNYIAINPMYSTEFLKNNSEIQDTHSAMILEKLIGQLVFKIGNPSTPTTATSNSDQNKGVKT